MIKLISVNIEGHKHIDKILPLIEREKPDVLCMQEVLENDVATFTKVFGVEYIFSPILLKEGVPKGNLIISNIPTIEKTEEYFLRNRNELLEIESGVNDRLALVFSTIQIVRDGKQFRIGTAHLPKSRDGRDTTDFQRTSISAFLDVVGQHDEILFCGDFNAPRGYEIFSTVATKYKDNIDPQYETSLDATLHAAGYLPYMVDVLFTTPHYNVSSMRFETGVSDHYAMIAHIDAI